MSVQQRRPWCDDHLRAATSADVPESQASFRLVLAAMQDDEFYGTAYRIENGEGLPGDATDREVPPNRRPSTGAIRQALERHGPVCCYLDGLGEFERAVGIEE